MVQYHIQKDSSVIPVLSLVNPIPYIETYFSEIYSDNVLSSVLKAL